MATVTVTGRAGADPELRRRRAVRSASERFWARVDKAGATPDDRPGLGACWVWMRGGVGTGYGSFDLPGRVKVLAHRWAYETEVGPIPDGMVLDHLCRNRRCVRPEHLEPVTALENLRRGAGYALRNGMRNSCRNGHEYTPENTYLDPTKRTVRCRECARARDRQPSRRQRKAA